MPEPLRERYGREQASLAEEEAKLRVEVDRAARARAILEDPLVVEAFQAIERNAFDAWTSSPGGDVAGRERLYDFLRAAREFRRSLESALTTGKMAARQVESVSAQRAWRDKRLGKIA